MLFDSAIAPLQNRAAGYFHTFEIIYVQVYSLQNNL